MFLRYRKHARCALNRAALIILFYFLINIAFIRMCVSLRPIGCNLSLTSPYRGEKNITRNSTFIRILHFIFSCVAEMSVSEPEPENKFRFMKYGTRPPRTFEISSKYAECLLYRSVTCSPCSGHSRPIFIAIR